MKCPMHGVGVRVGIIQSDKVTWLLKLIGPHECDK